MTVTATQRLSGCRGFEEERTFDHHRLADLETPQDLGEPTRTLADLDLSATEPTRTDGDEDHGLPAVAHHGVLRNHQTRWATRGTDRCVGIHQLDLDEHARAQPALGIGHIEPGPYGAGAGVDLGAEVRDLAGERLSGKGVDPGPSLVVMPVDYRENPKLTERLGEISFPI